MSESSLRSRLLNDLAKAKKIHGDNLLWWSVADNWISGLPDINVLYYGRFCGLELKADDGTVSPKQAEWLMDIRMAGGRSLVIRADKAGPLKAVYAEMGQPYRELPSNWLEEVVKRGSPEPLGMSTFPQVEVT